MLSFTSLRLMPSWCSLSFYWIQRTFGGVIDVDGFARLFELHIQKKRVEFDEEEGAFETQFSCCMFTTRRKNESKKIFRVELSMTQKNRWDDEWLSYWFYIKIDMSEASGYGQPFYPFFNSMSPLNITTASPFLRTKTFWACEDALFLLVHVLPGET